jgi:protein-tyrosine-phosphatase
MLSSIPEEKQSEIILFPNDIRGGRRTRRKRRTRRTRRIIRTIRNKKQRKRTKRRGGGPGQSTLLAVILLTLVGVSNGKKYFMTACAGNTCRSPMAEAYLKDLVSDPNTVSSFGVNVRVPNSPMAPLTEKIALDICKGNEECIIDVKNHKSKSFDLTLVNNILNDPENTLQIIPMDSKTANGVKDLLRTSGLNDDKLSRITVGANCDTNGVCEYESAEAPDPFFARGTRFENKAYYNTSKGLSEFIPAKVLQQTPNPQFFNRNPKYKTQKNNFNSGR